MSADQPDRPTTPADEQQFLSAYDPGKYPAFAVTVDIVLLTIRDGQLKVLLIERGGPPFEGHWALPGGFVEPDEDTDAAAARELVEETGVQVDDFHLEQLRTYSAPDRDPRMRVVSVAYVAFAADLPDPVAGSDAARARFFSVADLGLGLTAEEAEQAAQGTVTEPAAALAFDHDQIILDGVARARAKLEYTTLATSFLTEPFTIGDLRRIYETAWGTRLHPANFARKVTRVDDWLVPTDDVGLSATGTGRPAQLYTTGDASEIVPPLTRD